MFSKLSRSLQTKPAKTEPTLAKPVPPRGGAGLAQRTLREATPDRQACRWLPSPLRLPNASPANVHLYVGGLSHGIAEHIVEGTSFFVGQFAQGKHPS